MTKKLNLPPFEFLKTAVDAIQNIDKQEDKWQTTFDEMFDGHIVPMYNTIGREAIIKLVELAFDDKPDEYGSMFSWWLYEAECGKNKSIADSLVVYKKPFPVRTVKDLYRYYEFEAEHKAKEKKA